MTGMGNITTAAEFNFYADPESAHVVLKRMQKIGTVKTKLVTWELCRQSTFSWVILTLAAHSFGCKNRDRIIAGIWRRFIFFAEAGNTTAAIQKLIYN